MRRAALACAAVAGGLALALTAAGAGAQSAAAPPSQATDPLVIAHIGQPPLTDAQAAAMVTQPGWEPRPQNDVANQTVPTAAQLAAFHAQNHNPYSRYVDGQYRGTTDQIIQWAAAKWGLSANLLRAVAATETWWVMSFVGNDGSSFGLFQVRTPYHCTGPVVCGLFRHDTAFNADYYGSIIRSYYDGTQTWLNTVSGNGAPYRAGELWNSIGYWASGRWDDPDGWRYVAQVKADMREQVWAQPNFVGR